MAALPNYYLSPEEYLTIERQAEDKSEYVDGMTRALVSGGERHSLIAGNVIAELNVQLRKTQCKVYPRDFKVGVPDVKKYFYPDVAVVCGETRFADDAPDVILNPMLIVEVVSERTAAFDRGKKFQAYQQIETLREYLLIAQDDCFVEHYLRQTHEHWLYTRASELDEAINLPVIKCRLALRDVYDKAL